LTLATGNGSGFELHDSILTVKAISPKKNNNRLWL